jgi:hypothetical protein
MLSLIRKDILLSWKAAKLKSILNYTDNFFLTFLRIKAHFHFQKLHVLIFFFFFFFNNNKLISKF